MSDEDDARERAKAYREILAATAKRLGIKPTDERAQTAATLAWNVRALREQVQARLLNGQVTDTTALVKLEESLSQHLPAAPVEHSRVTLKVSRTHYGICQKCGYEHAVRDDATGDMQTSAPGARRKRKRKVAVATQQPKPTNVVALRKPRSIHDGAPLKVEVSRDPNLGGFTASPNRTLTSDVPLPQPEPSK
jgi:hypothetical protein